MAAETQDDEQEMKEMIIQVLERKETRFDFSGYHDLLYTTRVFQLEPSSTSKLNWRNNTKGHVPSYSYSYFSLYDNGAKDYEC